MSRTSPRRRRATGAVTILRKILPPSLVAAALTQASGARAEDHATVAWSDSWRRVHLWEVIDALVLTVGDTEFEDRVPLPNHATWTQPILFDTWARNLLRGRTAAIQSFASTSTNIMYQGGALVPLVMDDYFAAAA